MFQESVASFTRGLRHRPSSREDGTQTSQWTTVMHLLSATYTILSHYLGPSTILYLLVNTIASLY